MKDDDLEMPPGFDPDSKNQIEKNEEHLRQLLIDSGQLLNDSDYKEGLYTRTTDLATTSNEIQATQEELDEYSLNSLEKKVLVGEMKDCDLYLKNLHKGFGKITSVHSLLGIVDSCLKVHQHRRKVLSEVKTLTKAKTIEFNDDGSVKTA